MFAWVGSQFDVVLNSYLIEVVASLSTVIAPVGAAALTLWVGMYGWAVLRGEVSEPIPVFAWKVFKVSFVFLFSLNASFYLSNVAETATALASGVAATFVPASADPLTVSSPYHLLDTFNEKASILVLDLLRDAGIMRLDLVLSAVVCSIANVVFLCIAMFVITLAKLVLTFVIAVGPIFILCLAWKPTARFFDSWLSMLLNAVVLTWFSMFALGLSTFMGQAIVDAVQAGGGFAGPKLNVVTESLRYCVVMILMAIVCFQAPSLAAALTGGAVMQQGIQMMQNALIVSGLRSRSSFGAADAQGGVIRSGTGLPYTAGYATARAAAASARAAGTIATGAGAVATQGVKAARLAAYKLAALRGRR